jgi:hypothetical protein
MGALLITRKLKKTFGCSREHSTWNRSCWRPQGVGLGEDIKKILQRNILTRGSSLEHPWTQESSHMLMRALDMALILLETFSRCRLGGTHQKTFIKQIIIDGCSLDLLRAPTIIWNVILLVTNLHQASSWEKTFLKNH